MQLEYESAAGGKERGPVGELLYLAGPTIAQMASYTVMQFADTYMLAKLGTVEPTAAGNAGIFSFAIIGLGFGIVLCVNTLVSQHFGRKDYAHCGRYLWQGIWVALGYALLMMPTLLLAGPLFSLFSHEPALLRPEVSYFQITVGAMAFKLVATAIGQFLLAINRPWVVLWAAMAGMVANIGANWLLIYGNWGFPAMGVAGAAWGTNFAVALEMSILAWAAFRPKIRGSFGTWDWRPRLRQMRLLLVIGLPAGLQLVSDVLAWALFTVWVMAEFGTAAMAANTFMFRFISVSFMPAFGIASAVTALVGRYIGAGKPEIAVQRAHLGFAVTGAYMLTCGLVYILGRNELMHLFSSDPTVLEHGVVLLIFAGIYQLFDAMYIVYNGALRGAGDTLMPGIYTAVLCWGVTLLGGMAVAKTWPKLGPAGPWLAATLYGILLGALMMGRFVKGRWKSISLEGSASAAKLPGFDPLSNVG